ncbi:MAG: hypothetical protein QY323_00810 [Patescibacteria group bacterium]|nr:MAG: hypothetical protein QY323_00810 [Patescibacteria group bacterium]
MLRIILHLLILPAMLWIERRSDARLEPRTASAVWYAIGIPLMLVEALAAGAIWKTIFLQSLVTALFFLPGVYAAFRLARPRGKILLPFLVYLACSGVAGVLSGLVLAHTAFAFGKL